MLNASAAVVLSLPKAGPIQTGYEEKLALYRYVQVLPAALSPQADVVL